MYSAADFVLFQSPLLRVSAERTERTGEDIINALENKLKHLFQQSA